MQSDHETLELHDQIEALTTERDQLAEALETRIVIEQAKGVLAERFRLTVDDAFLLLRRSARTARVKIHDLAREVVSNRETPPAVPRAMARDTRLRAIAMRERTEATAETTGRVQARHSEQVDRLNQQLDQPTARVRMTSRSDALDLAAWLGSYRWYLIAPDEEHWEVVIEYAGPRNELSAELRGRLDEWLAARSLPSVHVKLGRTELQLGGL
ncbi:MAG TPA: ANTAR domain-containing protein [Gaiellaceae bacterium]|nr:ANTAR domain-containing protein [Gaiellaceae bacterium]